MSGGGYGATGGNMYGGMKSQPIGGDAASRLGGAMTGGNMYGKTGGGMNPALGGAQIGGNMGAPGLGAGIGGGPGEVPPWGPMGGETPPWGPQIGGNMGNPLGGATTNPVGAGGYAPPGAYGPRWATWRGGLPGPIERAPWSKINPEDLRGPATPMPTPTNPGTPGLPISAPPATKAGAASVDHAANFRGLLGTDPMQAYLYGTGAGGQGAADWYRQNQSTILNDQFGGNQDAFSNFKQNAINAGGAVTPEQMASMRGMGGFSPPAWALDAYKRARAQGQPVNPMYEPYL